MAPILVVNVGSSSFKWAALEGDGALDASGNERWTPSAEAAEAQVSRVLERVGRPRAIGHRMVHGGPVFVGPVRVDALVRATLETLRPLAPKHMTPALAAVDACSRLLPEVPQVCAFDTTFHATMPEEARLYGVPPAWAEPIALRRYGFHGLSVAYAVRKTEALLGGLPPRVVVCHLGSGASVTAVREGCSADTSMGYTPLDGLVMASRPGHLDPGAVIALADHLGISPRALEARLEDECGLLGLTGTSDLREVLARADGGEARARTAYGVYLTSLIRTVGASVGVLGGLDVLVFTGGVGEHSARVRRDTCQAFAFLGVALERDRNETPDGDADLAQDGAPVRVLRIVAREDLSVLTEVQRILGSARG
ncbi:MAG: acetate/propionate family kinase [Myxococcaceae bacterium]